MTISLQPFCDKDSMRFSLREPFVQDGYEYATDGRIMARRKTDQPNTDDSRNLPKNLADYYRGFPAEFAAYPERILEGECDCCNGGTFQCECCGHSRPCETCWGTSKRHVRVGAVPLAIRYDRVIRDLPGVQFGVIPRIGHEVGQAIAFRCEDVEGICMQMKEPD